MTGVKHWNRPTTDAERDDIPVDVKHAREAQKMFSDEKYEEKIKKVMAITQGRRIAGRIHIGSLVDGETRD